MCSQTEFYKDMEDADRQRSAELHAAMHRIEKCKHGKIGAQCRCHHPNKRIEIVDCEKVGCNVGITDEDMTSGNGKKIDQNAERDHDTLTVWKDRSGEYRWSRKARNGKRIATSGEGYINWQDCFDICQSLFPGTAIVVDISGTQFVDEG